MNENACDILKIPFKDGIGTHLSYFIPKPYNHGHDQWMKDYFYSCTQTEINSHSMLLLQTMPGYLIEMKFIIKLTAVENRAYILASLIKRNTTREFAMISETGLIYNYSLHFPLYIGHKESNIRNKFLSDLIPNFDISIMEPCSPMKISCTGKEILLVHLIRKLRTTQIHILAVIHDPREINLWKEGHDAEQIQYFGKVCNDAKPYLDIEEENSAIVLRVSHERVKFISNDNAATINFTGDDITNTNIQNTTAYEDCKPATNSKSQDTSNFHDSISTNNSKKSGYNILHQSAKKLTIFTWILLFSIIAVICTNLAIAIYMYNDIVQTSTIDTFSHLGTFLYSLSSAANKAIEMHNFAILSQKPSQDDLSVFGNIIEDLSNIENSMLTDFSNWNYCSASSIILDPTIPIWDIGTDELIIKENLYNAIQLFINHCIDFIGGFEENNFPNKDLNFILFNSLGYLYEYTKEAMDLLVDCEIERIKSTEENIIVLLNVGIMILATFQAALIGYIVYINKGMNKFWRSIKSNSHVSYLELKRALLERLSTVHGLDYEKDYSSIKNSDFNSIILPHIYWRYIRKLLVFFIISGSYYFLVEFYLYKDCNQYLKMRPKLLQNFITRETSVLRINIASYSEFDSMMFQLWDKINMNNQKSLLENEIKLFQESINELRKNSYMDMISDSLKTRLFEKIDTDADRLKYGSFPSCIGGIFNSLYEVNQTNGNNVTDLSSFNENIWKIEEELILEFGLADHDSKDVINKQLGLIIYVTIGYSSLLMSLYLFYYVPFLHEEKKLLMKLKILPTIIPKSKIPSMEDSDYTAL